MLPQFDESGLLPPGIYNCDLEEIKQRLTYNQRRQQLFDGLQRYIDIWVGSQFLSEVYVDGSFVTAKDEPGDIDLLLVPTQEALALQGTELDEMLRTYCIDRDFTKQEYGCEAFPALPEANLVEWLDFFGHDKINRPRGIIKVPMQ